jgi:hypothetical protein
MHNTCDIKIKKIKMYLYIKCNVEWGIWNTKFEVINQHKIDMYYV